MMGRISKQGRKHCILLYIVCATIIPILASVMPSFAAVEWVSPSGHSDPDSSWWDEENAYDDDAATFASSVGALVGPNHYLELSLGSAIDSNKVRVLASSWKTTVPTGHGPSNVDIDVYYEAAWHNIYSGSVPSLIWTEIDIPEGTKSVTKARVKWNTLLTSRNARIYEFDFYQTGTSTKVIADTLPLIYGVGITVIALLGLSAIVMGVSPIYVVVTILLALLIAIIGIDLMVITSEAIN